jgi:hypothetical protein
VQQVHQQQVEQLTSYYMQQVNALQVSCFQKLRQVNN